MGQIIPIYGFGIFLYILYILFKVSGIILIILHPQQSNIVIKIIVGIKTLYKSIISLNLASSLEGTEDSCYLSFTNEKIFTQLNDFPQDSQLKLQSQDLNLDLLVF